MRPARPRTLLLDQDCVCVDFARAWVGVACDITGRDYQYGDVNDYNIAKALGLTVEQSDEVWKVVRSPGWVASLPEIAGARAGVDELRAMGIDIRALTAPLANALYWKHERDVWIETKLGIPFKNIIHAHDKALVWGDYLLDDKVEHLVAWQEHHTDGVAVRYCQPWNTRGGTAFAVNGWPSFVQLIRDLESDY